VGCKCPYASGFTGELDLISWIRYAIILSSIRRSRRMRICRAQNESKSLSVKPEAKYARAVAICFGIPTMRVGMDASPTTTLLVGLASEALLFFECRVGPLARAISICESYSFERQIGMPGGTRKQVSYTWGIRRPYLVLGKMDNENKPSPCSSTLFVVASLLSECGTLRFGWDIRRSPSGLGW
jgi:hypothetical protein